MIDLFFGSFSFYSTDSPNWRIARTEKQQWTKHLTKADRYSLYTPAAFITVHKNLTSVNDYLAKMFFVSKTTINWVNGTKIQSLTYSFLESRCMSNHIQQ